MASGKTWVKKLGLVGRHHLGDGAVATVAPNGLATAEKRSAIL
jgi:hypothetical protein